MTVNVETIKEGSGKHVLYWWLLAHSVFFLKCSL